MKAFQLEIQTDHNKTENNKTVTKNPHYNCYYCQTKIRALGKQLQKWGLFFLILGLPRCHSDEDLPANAGDTGDASLSPVLGRSPGVGNGNRSGILAWEIPWAEEPGGLQTSWTRLSDWTHILILNLRMCSWSQLHVTKRTYNNNTVPSTSKINSCSKGKYNSWLIKFAQAFIILLLFYYFIMWKEI